MLPCPHPLGWRTRSAVELALAVALALTAAPGSALAVSSRAVSSLAGAVPGAALGIRQARLTQADDALRLSIALASDSGVRPRGSRVCAAIAAPAPTAVQWCLTRRREGWRATVNGAPSTAVTKRGHTWLTVAAPLTALGLHPGTLRWSVETHATGCTPQPGQPCDDRAPAAPGTARAQLWTPVVTGCRPNWGAPPAPGKRIAITFDDGPSPYTARVHEILTRYGIRATFFVIGRQVAQFPAAMRDGLAEGDEIGNHTWDHPMEHGGGSGFTAEVTSTDDAVRKVTGFTPCLFRPPGGVTDRSAQSAARSLGLATVLWSVDPRDWASPGTDAIVQRILSATKPGSVILDHDGGGDRSETLAALPTVISTLQQRGFQFVTVSELRGDRTVFTLRP